MGRFDEVHARSIADPNGFWGEAAEDIFWRKRWDKVLDDSEAPLYRWFSGGVTNTCYNCLDRHVEGGRAQQPALIYDSPVTDSKRATFQRIEARCVEEIKSIEERLQAFAA